MEIEKNIKKNETVYEDAVYFLKHLQVIFFAITIGFLFECFCFLCFYLAFGFDTKNLIEAGKWLAGAVVFITLTCLIPSVRLLLDVAHVYIKENENK